MNDLITQQTGRRDFDLAIVDGDFVVGESTPQHKAHLLIGQKGEYKVHPEVGVGIDNMLNDDGPTKILRTIRRQYEHDGMTVKELAIRDGKLIDDAEYN